MEIWEYVLLFAGAIIGGIIAFMVRKSNPKILRFVMALTGAFIFGITLVHLLPELYETHDSRIGFFVLFGFALQIGVEHLSHGIEHGHIHYHPGHKIKMGAAISITLGLAIHCFMEGMPIGGMTQLHEHLSEIGDLDHEHHHHHDAHNFILYGVMSHKAPAAFALVTILLGVGISRLWTAVMLVGYAMMSPLGAAFATWMGNTEVFSGSVFLMIMAVVTGSFLHISTTILFEAEEHNHAFSVQKTIAVLVGFGLSLISF